MTHQQPQKHLAVSQVLRIPAFRLFLLVQFTNSTIVWILATTVQWLFVATGQSGFIVASVPALLGLPFIFLALPIGVMVVRWLRPRVIAVGMLMIAVSAAGSALWVMSGTENVLPAIVSLAVSGVGLVTTNLAWQSLYPLLTGRQGIVSAAVLDGAAFNGARAIGPLIAGILLAVVAPDTLLLGNGVLALLAMVLAFSLSRADTAQPVKTIRVLGELSSALRFARYSRWTQSLILRMVGFGIPASGLWALLPIYSRDVLGVDSTEFGYLFAATGAGAVLGTIIVGPMRARLSERAFAGIGAIVFGLSMGLLGWFTATVPVVLLLLMSGVCWVTVQTLWLSLAQRALPDWVRAGIIGLLFSCFQCAQVLGSLFWGALADWFGVVNGLMATGGFMVLIAIDILIRGVPPTEGIAPDPARAQVPVPPADLNPSKPVVVEVIHHGLNLQDTQIKGIVQAVRLSRLRYGAQSWSFEPIPGRTNQHREIMRFSSWQAYEIFEGQRLTIPELEVRLRLRDFSTHDTDIRVTNAQSSSQGQ